MKKEEILLSDINRILFGQAPPEFLIETFFRTLIIYIVLQFAVRDLGKRMTGQLTIMEMAVMLTLGAIVSVPMQVPDRGMLQAALLLLCAVKFQRGISSLGFIGTKVEYFLQGKPSILVRDGVLQVNQMQQDSVSHQQVYAHLRNNKIYNLGLVERLYLEAEGTFSVFEAERPRPGLSILPPDDDEILEVLRPAHTPEPTSLQLLACINCGQLKSKDVADKCDDCGHNEWVNAVEY